MTRHINSAEFDLLVWDADVDLPKVAGGSDEGAILVRLDVDQQWDACVYADLGQTGDLTALRRAITALQRIHDELTSMYADQAPVGRCTHIGEWGRCTSREDHLPGEHHLPTRESCEVTRSLLAQARTKASGVEGTVLA